MVELPATPDPEASGVTGRPKGTAAGGVPEPDTTAEDEAPKKEGLRRLFLSALMNTVQPPPFLLPVTDAVVVLTTPQQSSSESSTWL